MNNAFDKTLETKVLMGNFQYSMVFAVGCMNYLIGAEILIQQILLSALRREWELSSQEVILLPFVNYWGLFVGALTCSFLADKTGRKNMLFLVSILQFFVLIANANVTKYIWLLMIFFLYGVIYGIVGPVGNILITEASPERHRGKLALIQQVLISVALVSGTLLLFVFMEDYGNGNWRGFIYVFSVTALIASIAVLILVRESPKFYISQGYFKKGFDLLNYIGRYNQPLTYEELTDDEVPLKIISQKIRLSTGNIRQLPRISRRQLQVVFLRRSMHQQLSSYGFYSPYLSFIERSRH